MERAVNKLDRLIEAARGRKMTAAEAEEQRINFAWGNAPEESSSTIESVREAARRMKETTHS